MRYIMSLLAIVLLVQYMTLPTVAVHVGLWSSEIWHHLCSSGTQ